MNDLRSHIRELESDNASLAAAAEQAAALAEEYAADAAQFRSGRNSSQTALINELNDATRRKDRRIQRLTTMLDSEREEKEKLASQVNELQDLLDLAGEMENTLRGIVQELNGGKKKSQREDNSVYMSVLTGLRKYMPKGDIDSSCVFLHCVAIETIAKRLLLFQTPEKRGLSFASLTDLVLRCIQRSVAWLYKEPSALAERGTILIESVKALQEKLQNLDQEVSKEQYYRWTGDFFAMKEQVIVMAVNMVNAIIPSTFTEVAEVSKFPFHKACEARAATVKEDEANEANEGALHELQSRLNATKIVLQQRVKEVDNLRVRNRVFEEKINSSIEDAEKKEGLEKQISSLKSELSMAIKTSVQVENVHASKALHEEKPEENRKVKKESISRASPLEQAPFLKESEHLRSILVQRELEDLQCVQRHNQHLEYNSLLYKTVSKALNDARLAASKARVIRLDQHTLQPKTRGATMSRQGVLQSLLLLRKSSQGKRDVQKYGTTMEMHLASEQQLHDVVPVIRKCLAL